jgi:hypothetical protein
VSFAERRRALAGVDSFSPSLAPCAVALASSSLGWDSMSSDDVPLPDDVAVDCYIAGAHFDHYMRGFYDSHERATSCTDEDSSNESVCITC